MIEVERASAWQFWIDRGGTFTDVVARTPDGAIRCTSSCRTIPSSTRTRRSRGSGSCCAWRRTSRSRRARSTRSRWAPRSPPTPCSSAAASRPRSRSPPASAMRSGSATSTAPTSSPGASCCRRCCTPTWWRSTSACAPTARSSVRSISRKARARSGGEPGAWRRALAIVLMHGYRHHAHELALAELARELGFAQVSVSHQVSPLMKLVSRGDTTVVDAYLSPILRRYVDQLARALGDVRLMFMQSNGGLVDAQLFQGKDAILSGPAGGIVGGVRVAAARRLRAHHHVRHGRHLDRRRPLRRRLRADLRDPRSRACGCARR